MKTPLIVLNGGKRKTPVIGTPIAPSSYIDPFPLSKGEQKIFHLSQIVSIISMKAISSKELTEVDSIINHLCSMPRYATAVTTSRIARQILLRDMIMAKGVAMIPVAKSRGCGVYQLHLEEVKQ